jgi:toxin YoeB
MSRRIVFEANAFADFTEWTTRDRKLHQKIITLIKDIDRSPFEGIGKPEPLKHELSGYWSRRINTEHRLVYSVTETEILIISCRYHYQ